MNAIEKEFWLKVKQNNPTGWKEVIYQVKEEWEKDMNKSKKLRWLCFCKNEKGREEDAEK